MASGVPSVTVMQTARELKQAEDDLWLRTGRGRREAHVSERHLSNMLLATATGTPIRAVENVRLFRGMVCHQPIMTRYAFENTNGNPAHIALTFPDADSGLFSEHTLGAQLENLVRWLAFPDDQAKLASMRRGFLLKLVTGDQPSAEFVWPNALLDGQDRGAIYRPSGSVGGRVVGRQLVGLRHVVELELPLLESLADLWRDSADRSGLAPTSPSGNSSLPGVDPGNENAALPGAAPRQPRTRAADVSTDLRHSTRLRVERQPRVSRLGSTPAKGHARDATRPTPA